MATGKGTRDNVTGQPVDQGPPSKRPYQTPQLIVYGTLHTLTQIKGGNTFDGAAKPFTKVVGTPNA